MRAVVVDHGAPGHLVLGEAASPDPQPGRALVRVEAFSLNRGELIPLAQAAAGTRPGWDLAGTVEAGAPDGSGPAVGRRVVGFVPDGAWAERVAVPTAALAELSDDVSAVTAATLPVAGLTALHAVRQRGDLLGRRVLVTGVSGGVGSFAAQLARLGGADVVAHARTAPPASLEQVLGDIDLLVSDDVAAAAEHGRFDLVIDSVGGTVLGTVTSLLAPEGVCVALGYAQSTAAPLDLARFLPTGGARVYGLNMQFELAREPAGVGLARLVRLLGSGRLRAAIGLEADWRTVGDAARSVLDRQVTGKAVLTTGA